MGIANPNPEPALLFFGLLGSGERQLDEVCERLGREFGEIIVRSAVIPFVHSRYYEGEIGPNLARQWALSGRLIAQDEIAGIKLRTNELEDLWRAAESAAPDAGQGGDGSGIGHGGGRRVNIDPGYVNLSKVVLATTKDFCHRLYLGRGIFAEVTLAYRDKAKGFEPWTWTYPDHREQVALEFFNRAREEYKRLLRLGQCET